jgi:membrane protein implicated in regulation of membrane protease activity
MDDLHAGWIWAIGGLLLLIAEILAPGFFLLFIGAAAIATGLFTLLFDLSLGPQLVLFVVYAGLAVLAGKRWYAQPNAGDAAHSLNDPARRLVGRVVMVVADVGDHGGRVRLGDSEWSARGGPAAAGELVRITGVDGNCLKVEVERTLPPA